MPAVEVDGGPMVAGMLSSADEQWWLWLSQWRRVGVLVGALVGSIASVVHVVVVVVVV